MEDEFLPLVPGYTRTTTKLPDKKELLEISETACRDGFIAINDLVCVLSSDDTYAERLPECWNEFQLNIRKNFPIDISTPENRVGIWHGLFRRWICKTVAGSTEGLKVIKGLPAYIYDTKKDELIDFKVSESDPDYVKIDELKSYFSVYLKIPLPALIFHTDKEQSKKSATKTRKNHLKDEVRTTAEKIWKKNPSITKADMVLCDEINSIPGVSELTERTIGDWIKDLNPNRRPGRRPKQT